jgi:hypothetical protein
MTLIPHFKDTGYRYAICQLDVVSGQTGAFAYHPGKPSIAVSGVYPVFHEFVDMLRSISCRVSTGDPRVFWENTHYD